MKRKWIKSCHWTILPTIHKFKLVNHNFELATPDFKPVIHNFELASPKQWSPSSNWSCNFWLIQVATSRSSNLQAWGEQAWTKELWKSFFLHPIRSPAIMYGTSAILQNGMMNVCPSHTWLLSPDHEKPCQHLCAVWHLFPSTESENWGKVTNTQSK